MKRYLTLARRARDENNNENAAKYYDLVLQKNPLIWEASFYQVYYTAMGCKIIQISSAAYSVANCLNNVFQLISEHEEEDKQEAACVEVSVRSITIAHILANAANSHYNQFSGTDNAKFDRDQRVIAAGQIFQSLLQALQRYYPDNQKLIASNAEAEIRFITGNSSAYKHEWALPRISDLTVLIKKENPEYEPPTFEKSGCYIAT